MKVGRRNFAIIAAAALIFYSFRVEAKVVYFEMDIPKQAESQVSDTGLGDEIRWRIESEQQWNQRIQQSFREIIQDQADKGNFPEEFEYQKLRSDLAGLQFGLMGAHLAMLEGSDVENQTNIPRYPGSEVLIEDTRVVKAPKSTSDTINWIASHSESPSLSSEDNAGDTSDLSNSGMPSPIAQSSIGIRNAQVLMASQLDSSEGATAGVIYADAFNLGNRVQGAQSKMWSFEPTEDPSIKKGWRKSAVAPGMATSQVEYISTLSWSDPVESRREWVPMISYNDLRGLQALRKVDLRMNLPGDGSGVQIVNPDGIVFGKVRAGWAVHYSASSEAPIFLDMNLQPVEENFIETDRYFIFLNAKTGSQLVFLSRINGESGGVAIPVIGNTATFVDLTQVSINTLAGQVFSVTGISGEPWNPLDEAIIRVVGQEALTTRSTGGGYFEIDRVLTVGSYPLFVETDRGRGFTHRYQVSPRNMMEVNLIRIPVRIVDHWVSQLPVEISAQSGLVVGSLPSLLDSAADGHLMPGVSPLVPFSTTQTLVPMTRTLSPWGDLLPNSPMAFSESWFVAAQVPEGPIVAHIRKEEFDESRQRQVEEIIWAEMTMASPGVIHVLGMY